MRLSQPETVADMDLFRRLMREHAGMADIMAAYQEYKQTLENIAQAKEMLEDAEMRDIAKEELAQLEPKQAELEKKIQILLLPRTPTTSGM